MRHNTPFPIRNTANLCSFLQHAWTNGWLDEYSDEHFLIKAIENRLTTFVCREQLIENNINQQGIINPDGSVNTSAFNLNFCINFSGRLQFLTKTFGINNVVRFMTDQMSAGKRRYKENTFFEALSEISILSFYASRFSWMEAFYEPPVVSGVNNKNPEARFVGPLCCRHMGDGRRQTERVVTINIEVKSPEFPHNRHENEKIAIPTMLLTEEGRQSVQRFCKENDVTYLPPRVLKLRDFLNSATAKFSVPQDNEFNLLYINWSYRDFPSNSFLEAWALLTNEINGILTHPKVALDIGVSPDAFKKISAVIVYTESLEGLMFSDFRYVWQRNHAGPRFRMWVINEKLREAELSDESNVLFNITGMNPCEKSTQRLMIDCKSKTLDERANSAFLSLQLSKLIEENVETETYETM